ncbi:MAG: division/cell wall cluster transcriptional repressor MraZ [Thiohalomonadaceae bacterium]
MEFQGGQNLFRGVTALTLDAKGRMAMPARYRDLLLERAGGNLVITIHTDDRCLWIYPQPEWEEIEAKIAALPAFNPMTTKLRRLLVGYATDTEMDGAGRILLAPTLREYAALERKLVLVGQGKKFELWDEERWNAQRDQMLAEGVFRAGEDLAPELQSLVL